jgi:hypothetical protein
LFEVLSAAGVLCAAFRLSGQAAATNVQVVARCADETTVDDIRVHRVPTSDNNMLIAFNEEQQHHDAVGLDESQEVSCVSSSLLLLVDDDGSND